MNKMNKNLKIMITELLEKFKSKNADFYIQTLIGILIFIFVLIIGITIVPVMISKIRVDYAADEIARYVALTGDTNVPSSSIQNILDTYNLDISEINIVADNPESGGETRVQLSDGFSVTVNHPVSVNFGGFGYAFNVDVRSVSRGRSEIYWQALDEP